jgi:hypothetical protein
MPVALPHNPLVWLLRLCTPGFAALALLGAAPCSAQLPSKAASTPPPAVRASRRSAHPRKKIAAAVQPPAAPVAVVPVVPPVPPAPDWPINDKPVPATVTWNSQGLRIDAANSSLEQILVDVSAATGTKVEGLSGDQRIFGAYGPGPARDVLSQLLHGSGYNMVMIGDQGQGTPRRILLSSQRPGSTPPANVAPTQQNDEDADFDEQPQPQPNPLPYRPGFPPAAQPRGAPQNQELQQRQQMMQQRIPPGQRQPPENPQN